MRLVELWPLNLSYSTPFDYLSPLAATTTETSGCTTTSGYKGSVQATTSPPYFTSSICPKGETCCEPGEYSDGGVCLTCLSGRFQVASTVASITSECSFCAAGTFQNAPGSSSCTKW